MGEREKLENVRTNLERQEDVLESKAVRRRTAIEGGTGACPESKAARGRTAIQNISKRCEDAPHSKKSKAAIHCRTPKIRGRTAFAEDEKRRP